MADVRTCSNCYYNISVEDKYCSNCGEKLNAEQQQITNNNLGPSTSGFCSASVLPLQKKSNVKSFSFYKKFKSQEWKSSVSHKAPVKKESTVQIVIGLMEFSEKEQRLKPKRGKRIALHISNKAPYRIILERAVEKWKAYQSDNYDEKEDYFLLLENGEEAQFMPGTNCKEFFSLLRYKEETGRDYNKIVLYLCPASHVYSPQNESDDSETRPAKKLKETKINGQNFSSQLKIDEQIARELQDEFDQEISKVASLDVDGTQEQDNDCGQEISDVAPLDVEGKHDSRPKAELKPGSEVFENCEMLLKSIAKNIDQVGQFFLSVRRGASFERMLSLWQRESKRSSPEKVLRVKYCGENGIDSGALSQEFLANIIADMGRIFFPDGAPVDSMYHVQNKRFQVCGQIVAVSLAQGGPPPTFLDASVYQLLVNPNINLNGLDSSIHFTPKDKTLLKCVSECELFDDALTDTILGNGYTGKIDPFHKEDIVETIKVNIITKRLCYMRQFSEGLKLFNTHEVIKRNSDVCKSLFITGAAEEVNANYVFSLVKPSYSVEGSNRRQTEENIIDNFQDFLMGLEDENVSGYSEPLAWKDKNNPHDDDYGEDDVKCSTTVNITPAGVLGWLTGQRHRPVNGEIISISVLFDHDCMLHNPLHRICFPRVSACSRQVTLPVVHMSSPDDFKKVFLLAMCKGNAFGEA